MTHQCLVMAFRRNGVNLSYLRQSGRHAELDIADERFHCRKSTVARGRAIAPLRLDMREEFENQRRVDLFKVDL